MHGTHDRRAGVVPAGPPLRWREPLPAIEQGCPGLRFTPISPYGPGIFPMPESKPARRRAYGLRRARLLVAGTPDAVAQPAPPSRSSHASSST